MADFYSNPTKFRAYFAARQIVVDLDIDDAEINAKLLVASEWIDNNFRANFSGEKLGLRDQVREWPRVNSTDYYGYVISSASVPMEIENAANEVALIEINSPGSLSVNFTPGKYKSVSIDGAISVDYAQFSSSYEVQTQFRKVVEILSALISGVGEGSSLSGVVARV